MATSISTPVLLRLYHHYYHCYCYVLTTILCFRRNGKKERIFSIDNICSKSYLCLFHSLLALLRKDKSSLSLSLSAISIELIGRYLLLPVYHVTISTAPSSLLLLFLNYFQFSNFEYKGNFCPPDTYCRVVVRLQALHWAFAPVGQSSLCRKLGNTTTHSCRTFAPVLSSTASLYNIMPGGYVHPLIDRLLL